MARLPKTVVPGLSTPIQNFLVFDSQMTDWQSLAAGACADTALLILGSGADGLTQSTDYLSHATTQGFTALQSLQMNRHD